MLKTLYTVGKVEIGNITGVLTWKRDSKFSKKYTTFENKFKISFPLNAINERYEVFNTLKEAEQFFAKRKADEKVARDEQRRKEHNATADAAAASKLLLQNVRVINEIKVNVLKEFRIRTILVPVPKLKKAMFSITGNKQFNKWSYNPTTDDDVFRFISLQQIDELYEVLNFI